jgi:hypothetical protein
MSGVKSFRAGGRNISETCPKAFAVGLAVEEGFETLRTKNSARLHGLIDGLEIYQAVDMLRERDDEQAEDFMDFIEIWRDVIEEADDSARGVLISYC